MTKVWYATVKYTNGKTVSKWCETYREAAEWERMEGDHVVESKIKVLDTRAVS